MISKLSFMFLSIFIFSYMNVFASTYKWSASINKKTALVNEAIHLQYICEFSDEGNLYAIDFNPIGTYKDYDLILLSEEERIHNNKRYNNFEFIVYAKKTGKLVFNFGTVMKKTTRLSIESTVLGRDNMLKEQFTKTRIRQKILSVDIKSIDTKLVGSFEINLKKDNNTKKKFEPFHMELIIKGHGDFQRIEPIYFEIKDVKVFTQKPIIKTTLTKDGYKGTWSQKFAFVGDKSFIIPEFKIKYANPKTKHEEQFISKDIKINILQGYEKEELLDKKDKEFSPSFDFIYYVLTFIAGYLLGLVKFKIYIKDKSQSVFKDKIKNCKTIDDLLILLILEDENKYKNIIKDIESKQINSIINIKKRLKVFFNKIK